ncbi:DUF502 domain-containing protein [Nitrospinae bacterium AH_259_B05_G02_I21]|nr:DUF502 domain-containing protein [Nitrospinae bacterium AH_259_B05_G02_I21]
MHHRIRRIFVTGLLATIPLAVTIFLLSWLFTKLDRLSPLITNSLIAIGLPLPAGFRIPGLGILATAILIFVVGFITTTFVGGTIVTWGEKVLEKIPLVRTVYGGAKQVVEAVASQQTVAFNQVVMVEYPRKGLYSLAFVTRDSSGEIQQVDDRHLIYLFVPTTPNPTSGMLIAIPKEDVFPLSMTVEEGIKLVMSGGLLEPKTPPSASAQAAPSLSQAAQGSKPPPTPPEEA